MSRHRPRPFNRAALARGCALACSMACVGMLMMVASTSAGARASADDRARIVDMSDSALHAELRAIDQHSTVIGEELLRGERSAESLYADRDAARDMLQSWAVELYRRRSDGGASPLAVILAGESVGEVVDGVRAMQVVGEHHARLVDALDAAEAVLDAGRLDRARLVAKLAATQDRRTRIEAELVSRQRGRAAAAAHARERALVRAAEARAAEAAAAAVQPTSFAPAPPSALVAGAFASPLFAAPAGAASAASIDAYLASKGSPMVGQGAAFMASGMRWQVDPRLLVAIAGAESSFGQIVCGPHNAWGWACPNDPADFATWADGIDTVTEGLRRYYLDEGRTSVTLIQQKYCPVGAANDPTGLNSHWTVNVTRFLQEQGGNPSVVGPGPSSTSQLPDIGGLGLVGGD